MVHSTKGKHKKDNQIQNKRTCALSQYMKAEKPIIPLKKKNPH